MEKDNSFQFMFSDKSLSDFDISACGGIESYSECVVAPQHWDSIHRIYVMYWNYARKNQSKVVALQFQSREGKCLMKTQLYDMHGSYDTYQIKEITLEDNERLIGVRSASLPRFERCGFHNDLQFVVGSI